LKQEHLITTSYTGASLFRNALSFVDLPEEIDLSSVEYEDDYRRVKVETADGK